MSESRPPADDQDDEDPGTGSGRGGPLGAPGFLPDEAPPSADQEGNEVVSGGGVVRPDDAGPGDSSGASTE